MRGGPLQNPRIRGAKQLDWHHHPRREIERASERANERTHRPPPPPLPPPPPHPHTRRRRREISRPSHAHPPGAGAARETLELSPSSSGGRRRAAREEEEEEAARLTASPLSLSLFLSPLSPRSVISLFLSLSSRFSSSTSRALGARIAKGRDPFVSGGFRCLLGR